MPQYAITEFIDVENSMGIIPIERTKRGFPALWEQGGGFSNTGEAIIIASPSGEPKSPLYIKRRGHLACRQHALFVVKIGDLVVECDHHRKDFNIRVWRISQFLEDEALLNLEYEFSQGEWSQQPPENLEAAINAATKKATCYHCRSPHYIAK